MRKNSLRHVVAIGIVLIATLVWELIEALFALAEIPFSLSVGPIGFDVRVIAVTVYLNPGTLIGAIIAYPRMMQKKRRTVKNPAKQGRISSIERNVSSPTAQ